MEHMQLLQQLAVPNDSKLVLLVLDGLGGLPAADTGLTELETARTPHMDALARKGALGLSTPIAPGITPGSAPAHLALFGYDALQHPIGRGVLSAVGIGIDLQPTDIACRINFATKGDDGVIVDRRAGRIPTEEGARLCAVLSQIDVPGVEVIVKPESQYRAVIVWRGLADGERLSPDIADTDPQVTGQPPRPVRATAPAAEATARIVAEFVRQADELLAAEPRANTILLRGFGQLPEIPTLPELYGLKPAVIATYPMYRGLAKLVGMTELDAGDTFSDQIDALHAAWDDYDYFFIHVKETDAAGEDGDFARKVRTIEEVDELLPRINELAPDVLVITGDHSTPAALKSHSWHPVPVLLSSAHTRTDGSASGFGEAACGRGTLDRVRARELMGLMLAHGLRLAKYGA